MEANDLRCPTTRKAVSRSWLLSALVALATFVLPSLAMAKMECDVLPGFTMSDGGCVEGQGACGICWEVITVTPTGGDGKSTFAAPRHGFGLELMPLGSGPSRAPIGLAPSAHVAPGRVTVQVARSCEKGSLFDALDPRAEPAETQLAGTRHSASTAGSDPVLGP